MADITQIGLPIGAEFLDTITPVYLSDFVSWVAIGARTTESQIHRQMASGLSMPVGFKNGTDGNAQIAIDAIIAANNPHAFLAVTDQGIGAFIKTKSNKYGHLILRGGKIPNYHSENVEDVTNLMKKVDITPNIMIDCSHSNSRKR